MGEMISHVERQKLERAGTLHWFHWVVVLLSLVLTFSAWFISKSQLDEKRAIQFAREADQAVELILERMQKYEDALWSGVAFIQARGGDVEYDEWAKYAESIGLDVKYPGINGIGVIHAIKEDGLANYLARMQKVRPVYEIHPEHEGREYYPISYIEPVKENEKAVGLDMAHETNRFTAAKKARDTGNAQITGPITLVQDSGQTPGFLFYAPFYFGGTYASIEARQKNFTGLVYAPFVVKKLMEGVLAKQKRSVGLRIEDGQEVLYDEHIVSEEDFDPDPLFKQKVEISLYGRVWTFDIWSARSFREVTANNQPTMVLVGGLIIDGLLVALFIFISRTSRRALVYADAANRELVEKAARLEESNQDLEHFAYVASHDLQEPLRMVGSFSELIERNYKDKLDEKGQEWLGFMTDGAHRMQVLVKDLLAYSQVGREDFRTDWVDTQVLVEKVLEDLGKMSGENSAEISLDPLPKIKGDESQLRLVFQNLISNAIKFHKSNEAPKIHVGVHNAGEEYTFSIKDNGIGIDPAFSERIFVIFQRLHGVGKYTGTGLGLAICKKIVERHGGRIWVESVEGEGSTFSFTLTGA